jgi:peptidoglycan/xylan/chitin deacetylase (PgdA/CDA1 family)
MIMKTTDEDSSIAPWKLGFYCKRDQKVEYHTFKHQDEAIRRYNSDRQHSKVLFKNDELIECSTASWDVRGVGVATLLNPGVTTTGIQDALANGTLPFVPPQRSLVTQNAMKAILNTLFQRRTVEFFGAAPYRLQSRCYYDVTEHAHVRGYVALSIDDAPCRFPNRESSELPRLLELLKRHDAKATFMAIGSWCQGQHREDLIRLLQEGHELGNHGMLDRSYEFDSRQDFEAAVDECSAVIEELQEAAATAEVGVRWFRAPHARYTEQMANVLEQRGLTNVMCDTYASCPIVQDGPYIANHLVERCQDGSIILLHMPEVHLRQWCWEAMVGLLNGLKRRNFKIVTVSELSRLAASGEDDMELAE